MKINDIMEIAKVEERTKIYIAGPFFKIGERERIEQVRNVFKKEKLLNDYDLFFPMDHFIEGGEKMSNWDWANAVFQMDLKALENADIMIAIYDKHYSDSGTAWELGYAYALGIPVILLCTDIKADNSIMPLCAATKLYDFDKFIKEENWEFNKNMLNSLK